VKDDDQNLVKFGLTDHFTRDRDSAVADAEYIFFCTAHRDYIQERDRILDAAPRLEGVVDACNLYTRAEFAELDVAYTGIGRGTQAPPAEFVAFVHDGFRAMERGVANEVMGLVEFLNEHYADGAFNRIDFRDVQRIAGTCVTGCAIADPGRIEAAPSYRGFTPTLMEAAAGEDVPATATV
jgi:hypothetical protein